MSTKKLFRVIMTDSKWISGIGFVVAIFIGFIRVMIGGSLLPDVPLKAEGILFFLITLIISEKFSSLIYQSALDDKIKNIDEKSSNIIANLGFRLMPVDLQDLGDGIEASKMLGSLLDDATSVKNTYFISLSKEDRGDLTDYNFIAGITIINYVYKMVSQGKYWKDVVSATGMERVLTLAILFKEKNIENPTYMAYKVDHDKPMINFIIIKYANKPSIVLFGWGLHKSQRMAPVFLSRHKEIVIYFEKYFESLTLEKTNQKIKIRDYINQDFSSLKIQLQNIMPDDLIQSIQDAFPNIKD